ncbi:MAG TPA: phage holin family protein [Bacillales bacterium]|nr:phage holin family protein [Bacillales bacterium]
MKWLFGILINAITLEITDSLMGPAFEISNFGMAIIAAIIMSVVNLVVQKMIFEQK